MTARKHLPVVQPDAVYEDNYARRKAIADGMRAGLDAAIAACGRFRPNRKAFKFHMPLITPETKP